MLAISFKWSISKHIVGLKDKFPVSSSIGVATISGSTPFWKVGGCPSRWGLKYLMAVIV